MSKAGKWAFVSQTTDWTFILLFCLSNFTSLKNKHFVSNHSSEHLLCRWLLLSSTYVSRVFFQRMFWHCRGGWVSRCQSMSLICVVEFYLSDQCKTHLSPHSQSCMQLHSSQRWETQSSKICLSVLWGLKHVLMFNGVRILLMRLFLDSCDDPDVSLNHKWWISIGHNM